MRTSEPTPVHYHRSLEFSKRPIELDEAALRRALGYNQENNVDQAKVKAVEFLAQEWTEIELPDEDPDQTFGEWIAENHPQLVETLKEMATPPSMRG